jgi:hypothetical protein
MRDQRRAKHFYPEVLRIPIQARSEAQQNPEALFAPARKLALRPG